MNSAASQKDRCQKDWQKDDFFKLFSLVGCPDKRTSEDESEPVGGDTQGEQSLAKVDKERDEALENAESTPIVRQADSKYDSVKVSKTEGAMKDN